MEEVEEEELEQELEETRAEVKEMIEKMKASTEETPESESGNSDSEKFTDPETGLEFDTREGLELFQEIRKE